MWKLWHFRAVGVSHFYVRQLYPIVKQMFSTPIRNSPDHIIGVIISNFRKLPPEPQKTFHNREASTRDNWTWTGRSDVPTVDEAWWRALSLCSSTLYSWCPFVFPPLPLKHPESATVAECVRWTDNTRLSDFHTHDMHEHCPQSVRWLRTDAALLCDNNLFIFGGRNVAQMFGRNEVYRKIQTY